MEEFDNIINEAGAEPKAPKKPINMGFMESLSTKPTAIVIIAGLLILGLAAAGVSTLVMRNVLQRLIQLPLYQSTLILLKKLMRLKSLRLKVALSRGRYYSLYLRIRKFKYFLIRTRSTKASADD
ncbi:hypothetical protein N752_18650 [Desulforamulus aquiferis]|nr:hypothetical protein N752_18650 [Desulforamulus aquiferis]